MTTSGRHCQWITFNLSFKMSFQVANIENPNRKDNTVVFSIFEAKDYRVNIKPSLERFKTQIKELQESTW